MTTTLRGDEDEKENFEDQASSLNFLVVNTTSTLKLVDLAGSKSAHLTGARKMQKKECGMINKK